MSFETMRQHQKKIYLPLAIVVTVVFVFFFGAGSRGCMESGGNAGRDNSKLAQLARLGHDLAKAGFISPMPDEYRKRLRELTELRHAGVTDEAKREEQVNRSIIASENQWYASRGASIHQLPMQMAKVFGIVISDQVLNERLDMLAKNAWRLDELTDEIYRKKLDQMNLSQGRFEELLRGLIVREEVENLLLAVGGASESELYRQYCLDKQRVRVQYCQRNMSDFLARVKVVKGNKPEKKADKPAAEKTTEEIGDKAAEEAAKKSEEEEQVGTIYTGELLKLFDDRVKQAKERLGFTEKKDFEWPGYSVYAYPDLFARATARVDYLLALSSNFKKKVKVTAKEIEDRYNKVRDFEYRIKPKADAKDDAKPSYKPLNSRIKKELRKILIAEKSRDAAKEAIDKAIETYNQQSDPTKRIKLSVLAAKFGVLVGGVGPAEEKALKKTKYLDAKSVVLNDIFFSVTRKALDGKFSGGSELDDQAGFVAVRTAEFNPVRLLSFKEARKSVLYRQRVVQAWKLAHKAIKTDLEALKIHKLDAKHLRQSVLLGPADEVSGVVLGNGLGQGEASSIYAYSQLLGPAAEKDALEKEKLKDGDKKELTLEEEIERSVAMSAQAMNRIGYRFVILKDRQVPGVDLFKADKNWRAQWNRTPYPDYLIQMSRMRGQALRQPKGHLWRQLSASAHWEEWQNSFFEKNLD
jgi:hypothetical protein